MVDQVKEPVWTHAMCEECWTNRYPNRPPVKVMSDEEATEHCCFCGTRRANGIFVRHNPKAVDLECGGDH